MQRVDGYLVTYYRWINPEPNVPGSYRQKMEFNAIARDDDELSYLLRRLVADHGLEVKINRLDEIPEYDYRCKVLLEEYDFPIGPEPEVKLPF